MFETLHRLQHRCELVIAIPALHTASPDRDAVEEGQADVEARVLVT